MAEEQRRSDSTVIIKNGDGLRVSMPLDDWVVSLAEKGARRAIEKGVFNCPFGKRIERRVGVLERNVWVLMAFLTGLGVLNAWNLFR